MKGGLDAPDRTISWILGSWEIFLDLIRLRVNGMSPTLSLIRLVIVRKSLRRVYSIISNKIEAETGRFREWGLTLMWRVRPN